jgi:hypothetical protein
MEGGMFPGAAIGAISEKRRVLAMRKAEGRGSREEGRGESEKRPDATPLTLLSFLFPRTSSLSL